MLTIRTSLASWTSIGLASVAMLAIQAPTFAQESSSPQQGKKAAMPEEAKSPEAKALKATAESVIPEVEKMRGAKFKRAVAMGVYSEEELRKFLVSKIFEEDYGEGRLERQEWYLTQLGFLPAGTKLAKTYLDVLLSQVAGFYDPDRESFFMLERAARMGDFMNRMMIAHELTHALDDQLYGLNKPMKAARDHDAGFAVGAVVEGSATALMFRWQKQNVHLMERDQMQAMMKAEMAKAKTLMSAPPYFHVLVARYMAGAAFIGRGSGVAKMALREDSYLGDVTKSFAKLPQSSEQILHPKKYWAEGQRDLPGRLTNTAEFEAFLQKRLDAKVVERDTMGEIHMAILTRSPKRKLNMALMANRSYWTTKYARGWGGDELWMLERADKSRGMLWITVWDSEKDRKEFEESYARHYGESLALSKASGSQTAVYGFGFVKELGGTALMELASKAKFKSGEREIR